MLLLFLEKLLPLGNIFRSDIRVSFLLLGVEFGLLFD